MPISSQVPIIGYVANGVTKSFAFPFAILSADDLKVKVGADVVTTGFSIAGVGARNGGSVTFTHAPASPTPIILYRKVRLDRTTDYQENGDLLAIVLDDDLDRIWMALQDQLLLSDRALRSPLGETMNSIPKASERALTVLGFDALGQPVAVTRTEDGGAALALDLLNPESGKGASLVGVSLTDGAPTTVKAALQNLDTALNFSTLPVASSPVADTDLMVLRQGGANKQLPVSVVRAEFATNAVAAAAAATAAKDGAVDAKTAAEAARDATVVGAAPTVYATTAAGLAATTSGKYFSVPSADADQYLILYLNDAGVAVEQKRYPAMGRLNAIYLKEQDTFSRGGNYDEKFAFFDLSTQTVKNLQDAAAITYTSTKVVGGLQIALSTARQCVFSTANKVGSAKAKINLSATTTFSTSCSVGISMTDGIDRWYVYVSSGNGWIVYTNSRGGGGILTQDAGAFTSGSVIEFGLLVDPASATAQLAVGVAGRAPFVVGLTNIAIGGIELLQENSGTSVVYSMQIETINGYQSDESKAVPAISDRQKGEISAISSFMAGYERVQPPGFSGRFQDYLKVYKNPAAGNFAISFSPNPLFSDDDPSVTRFYVDIASGSDTAKGVATAPIKSINAALTRILPNAKVKIYVKGGLYPYANSWKSNGISNGVQLEVVSWDGQPVISSAHDDTLAWTLDTGVTWKATFADSVLNVADAKNLTSDGDYTLLTLAANLANCNATPGSYFISETTIYVHAYDDRQPDSALRMYKAGTYDESNGRFTSLGGTLYLENIQFEGGKRAFYGSLSSSASSAYVYGKRCTFKYSATDSAPVVNGNFVAIWEECIAAWNKGDGFHWNPIFGSVPGDGIELNCIGRWNGVNAGGVGNNSSNHGGSTIRIKTKAGWGDYHHAEARGIHDILETENSLSWCLGITSRDSRNGYANFAVGLPGESGVSKMWLDTCTSSGAAVDLQAQASAVIYTTELTSGGVNSGTVTAYVP